MMLKIIKYCCGWLSRKLNIVANLTAENLALRQQLIVLKRTQNRPKLKERDRLFWVIMSRAWSGWIDETTGRRVVCLSGGEGGTRQLV